MEEWSVRDDEMTRRRTDEQDNDSVDSNYHYFVTWHLLHHHRLQGMVVE